MRIHHSGGFTLLELLVSVAILVLLLLLLVAITNQTAATANYTSGKVDQFREARTAFEAINRSLSQATLNTYWDYDNAASPTRYIRRSELRFLSGPVDGLLPASDPRRVTHALFFHAPIGRSALQPTTTDPGFRGLEHLLNVWGYYIEYNSDATLRPTFITPQIAPLRWRYRLMEFAQPSENLTTYNYSSGSTTALAYSGRDWYRTAFASGNPPASVRAENVIALIVTPRLSKQDEKKITGANSDHSSLAPAYIYDSSPPSAAVIASDARYSDARLNPSNQLPPVVQLTMVVVDEPSAIRLGLNENSGDVFEVDTKFRDSAKYTEDLLRNSSATSLEDKLISLRVSYRIFTTTVSIRAAKWSSQQVDKP